jgi:hypothetical protein
MNSRNIVLGISSVLGLVLAVAAGAAGCSSDNNNPTPSNNTGPEAGVDSSMPVEASTMDSPSTPDGTIADGGVDSATDSGAGTDSAPPPACNPVDYASDSGCVACGTAPLTACPLAALGVICIPFNNANVPDASF